MAHLEIEEEFEKKLLAIDQHDPIGYAYARQIPTDIKTAHAISCFYPTISTAQTWRALKDMVPVKRLFTAPHPIKRGLLNNIMKVSLQYKLYSGLINQAKDNPRCKESNDILLKKLYTSVPVAIELMEAFDRSLTEGVPLPERFDRNFE